MKKLTLQSLTAAAIALAMSGVVQANENDG
jgi:hypothetical protein